MMETSLLDVPENVLDRIVGLLSLRTRCETLALVNRALHDAVIRSIDSVSFYKEDMDSLSEENMKVFFTKHGQNINYVNFDMFRSTSAEESSQWNWRQAVTGVVKMCPNLTHLDILICNRHRFRDRDLETIFSSCPNLTSLRIDAQFVNGHSFKNAPALRRLEMEMCNRISHHALKFIFKISTLKSLYVSQLHLLSDNVLLNITRSFTQLRELCIISHPDSVYPEVTNRGMSRLANLPLRVLLVEGMTAANDRFLESISNPESKSYSTLHTISLAFNQNVTMQGLKRLSRLPQLRNLNLDGVSRRDLSLGLEQISEGGRLQRLLLAEKTNVSPDSLLKIVKNSPKLVLLDITNNENIFNWMLANSLVNFWCKSRRAPLSVLTDDHLPWNTVSRPPPDTLGRQPINVVHLWAASVPKEELLPTSILSSESPLCLPPGTLCPKIRKGNRYRLVFQSLGPTKKTQVEMFDDQGSSGEVAPLIPVFATELQALTQQSEVNFEPVFPSMAPLAASNQGNIDANSSQMMNNCFPLYQSAFDLSGDENAAPWMPDQSDSVFPSIPNHTLGSDWSLDVMSLLLTTHAFEDGAIVGPSVVKEGLLFEEDGSVIDLCHEMDKVDEELRKRHQVKQLPLAVRTDGSQRGRPKPYHDNRTSRRNQ